MLIIGNLPNLLVDAPTNQVHHAIRLGRTNPATQTNRPGSTARLFVKLDLQLAGHPRIVGRFE